MNWYIAHAYQDKLSNHLDIYICKFYTPFLKACVIVILITFHYFNFLLKLSKRQYLCFQIRITMFSQCLAESLQILFISSIFILDLKVILRYGTVLNIINCVQIRKKKGRGYANYYQTKSTNQKLLLKPFMNWLRHTTTTKWGRSYLCSMGTSLGWPPGTVAQKGSLENILLQGAKVKKEKKSKLV